MHHAACVLLYNWGYIIGCTIQVLYSHRLPLVVLALNVAEERKPALLLAIFEIKLLSFYMCKSSSGIMLYDLRLANPPVC